MGQKDAVASTWTACSGGPASVWSPGVTAPASEWEECGGAPAPVIESVTPNTGTAGTTVSVIIHGSGFTVDSVVTVT